MATHLVSYDLNSPGQKYARLIEKLESYPNWWHHLDSTWLIVTSLTAQQLRDELSPLVDRNDELLVIDVTQRSWGANGGFSAEAIRWLKANVAS